MASEGQAPPHDFHHSLPNPGVLHNDPYNSANRPLPPGGFPYFEMMPPPEVMEQKLSLQHIEISKLVKENQRLAATHGTLRQELATASNELRQIHVHVAEMGSEKEMQMRNIMDKMSMMEAELKTAEAVKMELQQAHGEAQKLVGTRQELISNMQKLSRDLQMAHTDAQQIPALMAELDGLTHEYHHARAAYEYEKKVYNDHLESLQVMEKNHMAMSREVEKLRAELTKVSSFNPRTGAGGAYSGYPGYGDNYHMGNYASGQNAYHVPQQGQAPLPGGGTAVPAGAETNSAHVPPQSTPPGPGALPEPSKVPGYNATTGTGYDPHQGHIVTGYDPQRTNTPNYDAQWGPTGPGYDPNRGPAGQGYGAHAGPGAGYGVQSNPGYDAHKGPVYDGHVAHVYDMQRGSVNDVQRGGRHDMQKGAWYDPTANRGFVAPQGQVSATNATYVSTAPSGNVNPAPPR